MPSIRNSKPNDRNRKYLFGSQKRRNKEKEEALIKSQAGSLSKFFKKQDDSSVNEEQGNHDNNGEKDEFMTETNNKEQDERCEPISDGSSKEQEDEPLIETDIEEHDQANENDKDNEIVFPLNIDDPGNWDKIDQNLRDMLVERGPKRVDDVVFPKDNSNRHFSSVHYIRKLPNGEKQDRKWLVYSCSLDTVICFCCKLFKQIGIKTYLDNEGFKDWKNIGHRLTTHETSKEHIHYMSEWIELERRLQKCKTIDESVQQQISKEKEHWRQVLWRIIDVVKRLAKVTLAFCGDNEKLYEKNNGNFLNMIEMIAEFNPTMQEHIWPRIREAKYFSVILDCTPDASHEDQMSLIIRCVDVTKTPIKVEEFFLEFLNVHDLTGHSLFDVLLGALSTLELDVDDIRGQSYDNGSNMKGKNKGVQSRVLEINPRAFYTPCGCHSLNLALCDIVNYCPKAMSFFGVVQRIYTLFSSLTKQWKVFIDHVQGSHTLKPLSQSCWENHIESVKPIRESAQQIRDALIHLANTSKDPKSKSEAESLAIHELENFEFLLCMVIWHELLFAINIVSKTLQKEDMHIDVAIDQLKGLISVLDRYKETGFEEAMSEAKKIASEMEIEPVFREKRIIRREKQFDESAREVATQSAIEAFRVDYFIYIVDQAQTSLHIRFEQFQKYEETFGLLFNLKKLKDVDNDSLKSFCTNLEGFLKHVSKVAVVADLLWLWRMEENLEDRRGMVVGSTKDR
ncbi:zinc finger MYM-type protein 5-like [Pyrus ussuriensis x Pyrus communis]|uniref:Zinc finger MYM-type protein 5-like n=1 Tax=Pyrus ussuriensis x Pyrus communis TaxID=2448454 RepID=A0A5N5G6N4_9ROSA|nr:zinc finger MYM-type protein 5-like [Pyrus ussuriensis x Pyrus communis]